MAIQLRTALAVFAIATVVPRVSAFAQTDTTAVVLLARSSSTAARAYEAVSLAPSSTALPINLVVTPFYIPAINRLRRDSPTFRRQCDRIAAAPQLLVTIESEPPRPLLRPAALTQVVRYENGRIRATVRIPASSRTEELIAHELEHVLEQLDGIDLRAKARLRATGVHSCDCGDVKAAVYETARAVSAERRVARELERDPRR